MGSPQRTPRLLVLTPDFPPARGGIQLLTHRLAAGMKGFDTRVLALDGKGAADSLSVRRVRAPAGLGPARMAALNTAAVSEALRFRPDVTLSMHVVASPAAALIRRALGARSAQYFHANEIGGKRRLAAFAARSADVSVAVSAYTAELIAATGAKPKRLCVIPPGVDLPSDPTRDRAESPTVVTIARLKDGYKGHDVLIRGAGAGARAGAGRGAGGRSATGRCAASWNGWRVASGVGDAVRFLGAVSDAERDGWLRRADVFAMPSRLPADGLAGEGFGIVYLEAAAYGKPVVAGNVAGALDAVVGRRDGPAGRPDRRCARWQMR